YERDDERAAVVDALAKLTRRFATGIYAVWYPLIDERSAAAFERSVRALRLPSVAQLELSIAPTTRRRGLAGSGMLVVNPPWRARALGGASGRHRIELP